MTDGDGRNNPTTLKLDTIHHVCPKRRCRPIQYSTAVATEGLEVGGYGNLQLMDWIVLK